MTILAIPRNLVATILIISAYVVFPATSTNADEWNPPHKFKNDDIRIGVYPRTPAQMAGFYEGRGFPKEAIKATTEYCFITIGIRNTGNQKIWLNLANWRFYNKEGEIIRKGSQQWQATWNQLKVPLSYQSTFSWTTLPEMRDLHIDEPVGGNVTLKPVYTPFTIEAKFETGDNREGTPLTVKIDNIRCLKNGEEISK